MYSDSISSVTIQVKVSFSNHSRRNDALGFPTELRLLNPAIPATSTEVFSFSLEGNELNAESSVFHRDGAMTTEEESQQTKQGQDEGRREPRFLVFPALKVKSLPTDR